MATETITTYRHTCDMCGAEYDETKLAKLAAVDGAEIRRGPSVSARNYSVPGTPVICDVCPPCQAKPISELLAWLDKAAGADAPDGGQVQSVRVQYRD